MNLQFASLNIVNDDVLFDYRIFDNCSVSYLRVRVQVHTVLLKLWLIAIRLSLLYVDLKPSEYDTVFSESTLRDYFRSNNRSQLAFLSRSFSLSFSLAGSASWNWSARVCVFEDEIRSCLSLGHFSMISGGESKCELRIRSLLVRKLGRRLNGPS